MRLDGRRAAPSAAFDDVGIQGSLHEESDLLARVCGLGNEVSLGGLECANEFAPNRLAFHLGFGDALQLGEELVRDIDSDESNSGGRHEITLDLFAFSFAQKAVVNEYTNELIADGFVHECRRNRRINTARQTADDEVLADLRADCGDLLVDNVATRPVGCDSRTVPEEVLEDSLAEIRMHDFGVPLQTEHPGFGVFEGRNGCRVGRCGDRESGWSRFHAITVAHPAGLRSRLFGEQNSGGHTSLGGTVFA